MKRRSKTITEHFDSVSSRMAGAMRSVFAKYKSLTESLGEVQRGMESAKAICQALYRTIDGPCWEILATDPRYRTDDFVQGLYDAMRNTSIRKWTREHLKIVNETKKQLEGVIRKAAKLKERFDADPHSAEAKSTATLLKRMLDTRMALEHRIEFTVKKFMEIRLLILKTMIGTSEEMFKVAGEFMDKTMMSDFAIASRKACEELNWADENAVRKGRKSK